LPGGPLLGIVGRCHPVTMAPFSIAES
jgi:hypothetical protein